MAHLAPQVQSAALTPVCLPNLDRPLTPYCDPQAHTASARVLAPLAVPLFRQPRPRLQSFYLQQPLPTVLRLYSFGSALTQPACPLPSPNTSALPTKAWTLTLQHPFCLHSLTQPNQPWPRSCPLAKRPSIHTTLRL